MDSRRTALAIAVIVPLFTVALIFFIQNNRDEEPPDEFRAYGDRGAPDAPVPDDESEQATPGELAVPTAGSKRAGASSAGEPPAKKRGERRDDPRAALRGGEDILNNPGPTAEELAARAAAAPDGEDESAGTLSKQDVRRGIKAVTPLVKACYEEMLADFPDAGGKVTVGFRIIGEDDEGRVELSELDQEKTTLFDEKLHDCMLESIGEATFDAPEGGGTVSVTYPFQFRSGEEDEE